MDSFDGGRRRSSRPPSERRFQGDPDPIEQRLERWVSAGRQLVDGVSGSRPGSRPQARRPDGRNGPRAGFDGLGRWVEDRLDWLLDDGEDWREPWQERERPRQADLERPSQGPPQRSPLPVSEGPLTSRSRRPLEAVSRRPLEARSRRPEPSPAPAAPSAQAAAQMSSPVGVDPDGWPEEEAFAIPRWQRPRPSTAPRDPESIPAAPAEPVGRRLPRSTRRR